MEFLYDASGITWEGAAVCSLTITLLLIGAGKFILEGIKYLRKNKTKK